MKARALGIFLHGSGRMVPSLHCVIQFRIRVWRSSGRLSMIFSRWPSNFISVPTIVITICLNSCVCKVNHLFKCENNMLIVGLVLRVFV